jgi:hypothetical protein
VQENGKRFQPWGSSAVDELMHLALQGQVMQVLMLLEVGLLEQEQLLGLVVVDHIA